MCILRGGVYKCVKRFFLLKCLILKYEYVWSFGSFWEKLHLNLSQCSRKLLKKKQWVKHKVHKWFNHCKRWNVCRRPTVLLPPFHKQNGQKSWKSSLGSPSRSLLDHWWNFWNNKCIIEFMPMHFNSRFHDETGYCRISAMSAYREAKQQACECLQWFTETAQKWPPVSHKSCNRWWELVWWQQPWVKAAVKSVEFTKFAQTKKSVASSLMY